MSVIRHRSLKPDTIVVLQVHKGKTGTVLESEPAYVVSRQGLSVNLYTESGRTRILQTNSVDAGVYTDPHEDGLTFRILHDQENAA